MPIPDVQRVVRSDLEGIHPQVDDQRPARGLAVRLVDGAFHDREVQLPVFVADGVQILRGVEEEDLVARARAFSLQQRGLVLAVQVGLEGLAISLVAGQQLVLDVRLADGGQQREFPQDSVFGHIRDPRVIRIIVASSV